MHEPQPIADAPAANANGAVVGLIPVAVITGISTFRTSSTVLEIVSSTLSINPLTPLACSALEKWPSVWIKSIPKSSSSRANAICSEISISPGIVTQKNTCCPFKSERVSFVSANGAYKEFGMMEGLDDSFDGICLFGYHTRSNTPGIMAHTIWGSMIEYIEVDGKELGETGINAILAHEYGVPIVLISGDDKLHDERGTGNTVRAAYS